MPRKGEIAEASVVLDARLEAAGGPQVFARANGAPMPYADLVDAEEFGEYLNASMNTYAALLLRWDLGNVMGSYGAALFYLGVMVERLRWQSAEGEGSE